MGPKGVATLVIAAMTGDSEGMKAFDFDRGVIGTYENFATSFTTVRAGDLSSEIATAYVSHPGR